MSAPAKRGTRFGFTFFGAVGAVMAALKLKEHLDQYRQVPSDEEGGQVRLGRTDTYRDDPDDSASEALLDTELARPQRKRAGCCVCCGLNCGLFWKAVGIILLLWMVYGTFKLAIWAFTPTVTGLEDMPAFGTALGCLAAPYFYNSSEVVKFAVPMGVNADHAFDVRGDAVGTITLDKGAADATEIVYELSLRTDNAELLDFVSVRVPKLDVNDDRVLINTPTLATDDDCARFDVTIRIPPTLRKLHAASHSTAHVQFARGAEVRLDSLFVTLFGMDSRNIIRSNVALQADAMSLEVYRGWIVGDVAVVDKTDLSTQRGDGVLHIDAHPVARGVTPAFLSTTTGAGRTDVSWVTSRAFEQRPIRATHMSSRSGDVRLTYRDAEFEGVVQLDSKSYSASRLQRIENPQMEEGAGEGDMPSDARWTHFVGSRDKRDRMYVQSAGWTGVYF